MRELQMTTRANHLRNTSKKRKRKRDKQGTLLVPWLTDDRSALPAPHEPVDQPCMLCSWSHFRLIPSRILGTYRHLLIFNRNKK
ncbi:hypothetical protein ASPBRDRAFT_331706 [Aspergillus brasiliensis CBS 101740]|uniref:Uncharacterized protein n=1 Tax=Aspergillus brasiliensis (strain CBS 101740 / IMI 381727 / IBT 21946) TaxID=767769 RepID=A0A1L9U8W3_ASPBC|nr:hypothetical protein ASPBRDRAFT_331706 [Aspergillus brasiliensis CBS 101740]